MLKSLLVAGVVCVAAATTASAEDADCKTMMELHGMLSRAQFQCGYSKYSNELMNVAKVCFQTIGEKESKDLIKSGMETFDASEKKLGHKSVCARMLKDFPEYVRK